MDIGYPFVPYLLNEVLSYGMAGGASYLAWRFVRAYERRCRPSEPSELLAARLALLEEAVERTVEAQRFTTRVFLERGRGSGSIPSDSSVDTVSREPGPRRG